MFINKQERGFNMSYDKTQEEATNRLLLDMVKNQKEYISGVLKIFIITLVCYTLILISMIIGFFIYESQFETEVVETQTTITQEVSGDGSDINNVEGNQYNDNATHNQ